MRREATPADETWIARKLGRPELFVGVTTADERRELVRKAIVDGPGADGIAARYTSGRTDTWRVIFLRVYGEQIDEGGEVAA